VFRENKGLKVELDVITVNDLSAEVALDVANHGII